MPANRSPRAVAASALAALATVLVMTSSGDLALNTKPGDWELTQGYAPSAPRSGAPARSHHRPLVAAVGLSRTGTSSLTEALSMLGFQTFHTQASMQVDLEFWYYYLSGQIHAPDVRKVLDGKDAVLDCWYAILLPEVVEAYPDVKLLLTTRDPEPWLRSYQNYWASSSLYHWPQHVHRLALSAASRALRLGPLLRAMGWIPPSSGFDLEKLPQLMAVWRLSDEIFYGTVNGRAKPGNHPLWRSAPARHEAYVRTLVPPEQLLEFPASPAGANATARRDLRPGHLLDALASPANETAAIAPPDASAEKWAKLVDFLRLDLKDPTVAAAMAQPYPHKFAAGQVSAGGGSNRSTFETTRHERLTAAALVVLALAVALLLWVLPGEAPLRDGKKQQ